MGTWGLGVGVGDNPLGFGGWDMGGGFGGWDMGTDLGRFWGLGHGNLGFRGGTWGQPFLGI